MKLKKGDQLPSGELFYIDENKIVLLILIILKNGGILFKLQIYNTLITF